MEARATGLGDENSKQQAMASEHGREPEEVLDDGVWERKVVPRTSPKVWIREGAVDFS